MSDAAQRPGGCGLMREAWKQPRGCSTGTIAGSFVLRAAEGERGGSDAPQPHASYGSPVARGSRWGEAHANGCFTERTVKRMTCRRACWRLRRSSALLSYGYPR